MVGFISLTQRIDEREKYERQELPWGAKWETKGANILVECVPLTWNEWEHPTDEMRREMNLLPTFEMREELSGYRIQFPPLLHYHGKMRNGYDFRRAPAVNQVLGKIPDVGSRRHVHPRLLYTARKIRRLTAG